MAVTTTIIEDETADISTAASTVFNIFELLEQILLHLPCRDIMSVQNVSKQWKSVFAASTVLQTGCFLRPIAAPLAFTGVWLVGAGGDRMRQAAQSWRENGPAPSQTIIIDAPASDVTPTAALRYHTGSGIHVLNPLAELMMRQRHMSYPARYTSALQSKQKAKPTSEWKKMYLTQPPTSTVHVRRTYGSSSGSYIDPPAEIIKNADGVTAGDLLRWMQRFESEPAIKVIAGNVVFAGLVDLGDESTTAGKAGKTAIVLDY